MSEAKLELHDKLQKIGSALKDYTQKISRSNSRQVANLLNDILHTLEAVDDPDSTITKVHILSIVLPLLAVYKSMIMEEKSGFQIIVEPWLKIMYFLLSRTNTKIAMPPQFTTELIAMLATLLDQSSSPANIPKPAIPPSEEIKHLSVKCLSEALPIKRKETLYNATALTSALQQESFFLKASQVTMALLNTIRLERNLQLRLDAISALIQLLVDNIQDIDKIAKLLPGVISKLCLTMTQRSENENHQLICGLLDAIGELISTVMCDDVNNTLESIRSFEDIVNQHKQPSVEPQQQQQQQEQPSGTKEIFRDKEWYAKVKRELRLMFGQILRLKLYPDWRTRLTFVNFSYRLLSTCSRTLDNCVQLLLDVLVLHADDAYPQVSRVCRFHMRRLLASASFGNAIMPVLKDNLYHWIMKFPQYVISKDEQEKTVAMSLIIGMIVLLEDQAESVLSMVLSRASDGWMTALEIDKSSLDILEEKNSERFIELGTDTAAPSPTPLYPRIRFKHIVTDMSTAKLNRLLNIIGKYCGLSSWVHHFMRYVSTENQELSDPQAAYVVHALMSGFYSSDMTMTEYDEADAWLEYVEDEEDTSCDKKVQLQKIAAQVLNDTMEILSAATSTNTTSTALSATTASLDDESGHVLTVCFGLQIVGLAAYILDQDYLQEQLITILYPLLAHLGSSNVYIHTYALITLDTMALQCGLDGAKALVIDNIDYIINSISQHISVLTHNARVPLVLKALIHVGGYACINYLDDTVEEIYDALERYSLDEWLCAQLCSVLFEVIQTLEKNIPPTTASDESNVTKSPTKGTEALVSPQVMSFIQQQDDYVVDEEFRSMEDIGKYFLDRQKKGLHDDLTLDQIMEQGNLPMDLPAKEDEDVEAPTDDQPIPLTHEQQMAKDIMDKASHFLTVSSPKLRSQILSLLASGVSILSDHPGELNKLVYSMWPSIANRFNDPENYVVLHAARLVEKISQVSTDFLSRNFTVDLWPRFKSLLQKGVSAAQSDPASTGYSVYSLYHRTQLCLLHTLAKVAYYVPVKQDLVKDILQTTRYYYRNDQVNQQLDEACQGLFKGLATQQADTVWLFEQRPGSCLPSPDADLLDVFQVPEWTTTLSSRNHRPGTLVQFK
ncbi:AP-1 adaptor complex mu subunit Apm1 [Mucor velutinosus]|uniref:AP-1 adaptor complex mu subunit Apm1 n=1 Tax=Mucor velutinosus TaxID=708070 RepID=A0AAN7I2S7_9FUNG|nr:AP-1 adaptor complex mu subunit Apm1 [Mucor velutinosus]